MHKWILFKIYWWGPVWNGSRWFVILKKQVLRKKRVWETLYYTMKMFWNHMFLMCKEHVKHVIVMAMCFLLSPSVFLLWQTHVISHTWNLWNINEFHILHHENALKSLVSHVQRTRFMCEKQMFHIFLMWFFCFHMWNSWDFCEQQFTVGAAPGGANSNYCKQFSLVQWFPI